jgi:hypothetical protein
VREESHLDEMRDAIRGDFERLAERRGEQELLRVTEPEESAVADGPVPEPEPEAAAEAEPEPWPEPGPEEAERRSWLARLFSP